MGHSESSEELLQDFDLSRLKSLRSLEFTASSMSQASGAPDLLRDILSTIRSPLFSEVILVFQRPDLYRPYYIPFEVFRQMHSMKKFRLIFCLEVARRHRSLGLRVMRQRMDYELAERRLDFLESPPTLAISERNSWTG